MEFHQGLLGYDAKGLFEYLPCVAWQRIQLDNTPPDADIQIDPGSGDCGKFNVGDDMLAGHFVARDTNFGSYTLQIKLPINAPGIGIPNPQSGVVQTALSPGDPWTLDITTMLACGYIIEVVGPRSVYSQQ